MATSAGSSRSTLHDRPGSSARRRGPSKGAPPDERYHHALGRSRGGLTAQARLAADSRSRPLSFVLTPGQAWRHPPSPTWLAHGFRPVGRPGTTPEAVLADKAYSSRAIRTHLRRREVRAVIPRPSDQIARRKKRGRSSGRPAAFDARWAHMPYAPRIRGDVVRRRACRCPDCRAPATKTELCGRFRRFTQEGRA
ncbi:transposase [Streptomyces murinus]|uniref:transposase n=1 Tax=Streptomyces murinus TaxID=33900 RepID=UPI00379F9AEE